MTRIPDLPLVVLLVLIGAMFGVIGTVVVLDQLGIEMVL